VFALLGHENETAIDALICLSEDVDDDTRDWAVFGLGAQIRTDTEAIRAALWKRVNDRHHDTRWEAINGLAVRRDPSIRPVLIGELSAEDPEAGWFEAAGESEDPAYLPALEKHLREAASLAHVNEKWLEELKWAIETIRQAKAEP
jgi:HEAT repeat protein